jgi:Mrp family chromosome partitioning ATPase/capsular polysaccharide biosynthesis protein
VGFEEQLRLVWRHRFWLLAFSLLAAIAVFVAGSLRSSTYTASAVLGVTPGVTPGQTVNNDTVAFATKYYERLVRSDGVLNNGAAAAGPGTTLEDMRNRISSTSTSTDGTVTVKADASNAGESVKVATAVANATIAQGQKDQEDERSAKITALQQDRDSAKNQLDALAADSPDRARLESQYQAAVQSIADQQNAPFNTAKLLESPQVPKSPGGPSSKSLALFTFLAALVLGAEGLVVLARLRRRSQVPPEEPAVAPAPAEPVGDDYDRMRVPLLPYDTALPDLVLQSVDEGHRLIAVIGSGDFPATNDVTLTLGQELAHSGHSTLVVEGDMAHPSLASRLSIRTQAGLTDVLAGGASLERQQRQTSVPDLFVLPAGRAVERPDVLIGVDNVQHALAASSCEIVLVSLPPSMSAEDRHRIAGQLHAVVSVVRDGRMRARQVRSALTELGELHHILVAVGLVDVLPSPDIEVVRRPERGGKKAAPTRTAEPATNGHGTGVVADVAPEPEPELETAAVEPEVAEAEPAPEAAEAEPEAEVAETEPETAEATTPVAEAEEPAEEPSERPAVQFTWPRR